MLKLAHKGEEKEEERVIMEQKRYLIEKISKIGKIEQMVKFVESVELDSADIIYLGEVVTRLGYSINIQALEQLQELRKLDKIRNCATCCGSPPRYPYPTRPTKEETQEETNRYFIPLSA